MTSARSTSTCGRIRAAFPLGVTPARGLFLLLIAVFLAIGAIFAVIMVGIRADARRSAEAAGLNLATALAQDMARNIELLDLSIEAARDAWIEPRVRALPADLRQGVIFDHSTSARYIDSVLVLGVRGEVLADSRSVTPRADTFADQDFFRVHAEQDAGLYVSRPIHWQGQSGWSMAFSRRMCGPDGSFAGVAVGILSLDYLTAVYRRLDVGAGGALFLFNTDGTMLVREPPNPQAVGRSFVGTPAFQGALRAREGSFEATSSIDGERRIYSFHRVGGLPLIQNVAVTTGLVFADWRRKVLVLGGLLTVLSVGVVALVVLLKRELAQRAAAEAALEELASRDHLTGLLNRRRFFEEAEARCRAAEAERIGMAVLMIDADRFKGYNDRHGHVAGDAVLAGLGRAIGGEIRGATDLAARFGGEEFIVLLTAVDAVQARVIAEAIRMAVVRLAIVHDGSSAGIATVSIGVAAARAGTPVHLAKLVEAADAALYRSKREGRNRTSLAEDEAGARDRGALSA